MKLEAGTRYGKWAIQDAPTDLPHYVICRCDCGTVRPVYSPLLTGGYSNSCGCSKTKHGLSKHPLYRHWRDMRYRCDTNQPGYEHISYDPRWKDCAVFIADVEQLRPRYRKGLTLDRINLRLDYSLANGQWATKKQQAENRRNSIFIHSKYGTFTLTEWWRMFNTFKSRKKAISLKAFKTSLQTVNKDVDCLLASLRLTDDQIKARIDEYQIQVQIDCLKKIGLTDEQIAEHLALTAHCADDAELVPA